MVGRQNLLQFDDICEALSAQQFAGGVDPLPSFLFSPHAHGVEVIQRQSQRIHSIVTRTAEWLLAMECQGFAQGEFLVLHCFRSVFQRRNVWWWWRGRCAEQIIEDKQASLHG